MNYLLDSHIFLWMITADPRMPRDFRTVLIDRENQLFLSQVSIWELLLKAKTGKLPLGDDPSNFLLTLRDQHEINTLVIDDDTIRHFQSIATPHRDPFDQMILAHRKQHRLRLLTVDENVLKAIETMGEP